MAALPLPHPTVADPIEAPENVYVRRILASEDFPAFSKVMSDLMASLRDEEASAQRLANLVLRDYALTVKVIRTANTVHYNRSGRAVQSATHAMMLLGARTVRDLASGLLLFEQYRRRSPGLKELMLLSLLTASHAREAAARRGIADPETAQLCGMFRNLGEVLAAAHLPKEYAEILRRTKEARGKTLGTVPTATSRLRAQATIAVLDCSFEDIGAAIARHWGMPDAVRRGMRAEGAAHEDPLELATAFAHALSTTIYREDESAARDGVGKLLETFAKRLDLTREALVTVADAAVVETRETFASARVALDDLRLTTQITRALGEHARAPRDDVDIDAPLAATPVEAQPAVGDEVPNDPPVAGPALVALRERLLADLSAAADDVATYELQRAVLVALEAALRGGPFDRACFCAADVRAGELRARFGLGLGVEELQSTLSLPFAAAATGVGAALLRGEASVLSSGTRLALHEAHWLRVWNAASVVLLPVTVDGTTIGAIYVDRRLSSAPVDAPTLGYLRRVVETASHALALRRARAPGAPARRTISPTEKSEFVLRVLRGESLDAVAEAAGVEAADVARWRDDFLAGALARLTNA